MNKKVNDKEQTFVIRNYLFYIRYSNNVLSNQKYMILKKKTDKFTKG